MAYRLLVSEKAENQIDRDIKYIVEALKNPSAAKGLLQDIENAYLDLERMPEAFSLCNDSYLSAKGYRKLSLSKHDYLFVYSIEGNIVFPPGFFHLSENYDKKL